MNCKKWIAGLLACILMGVPGVLSMQEMTVSASSGSCGPGCSWNYNASTRTLTISGNGYIQNYAPYEGYDEYAYNPDYAPWRKLSIKTINISFGVTSIGDYAFSYVDGLTSVTLPSTLLEIGDYAFQYTDLTSVSIPGNVKHIGEYAFSGCARLTGLNIADGVEWIEYGAFSSCISLQEAVIPKSVKYFESAAFYDCSNLSSITIENPNCKFGDKVPPICNSHHADLPIYHGKIIGYSFSSAHMYAMKYDFTFEPIGEAEETTEPETTQAPTTEPETTRPTEQTTTPGLIIDIPTKPTGDAAVSLGDLTGDSVIDIMDVIKVNKFLLGSEQLSDAEKTAADVDKNGEVDSTDSLVILKYVVELISSF